MVTIASDNPAVASVSPTTLTANGQVTVAGEKPGSTVIDVTFSGGDLKSPATVSVIVNIGASTTPTPNVSKTSLELAPGEADTFFVSLGEGYNAAESATITSNHTAVAVVDPPSLGQSGPVTVTGVAKGKTTITIGYSGGARHGKSDEVQVTVTEKDDGDGNGDGNGNSGNNGHTGPSSGARSRSSSSSGSRTADRQVAKNQLPASAFSWDGDRTLTINHDRMTALGLLSVRWDDTALTRGTEFRVYEGSVIIRFDADFIASQPPGDHTVRVDFLNHTGETTVTVGQTAATYEPAGHPDNNTHNPNTGGYPGGGCSGAAHNSHTGDERAIWPALLLGSLGAAMISMHIRKAKIR